MPQFHVYFHPSRFRAASRGELFSRLVLFDTDNFMHQGDITHLEVGEFGVNSAGVSKFLGIPFAQPP